MSETESEAPPVLVLADEADRVYGWRLEALVSAGYDLATAERVASNLEVDLHQAVDLVTRKKCSPAIAAKILL